MTERIYSTAAYARSMGATVVDTDVDDNRVNLIRHAASPHINYWRNLKIGYDYFEQRRQPPIVGVKDYQYVYFPHNVSVPPEFLQVQQAGFSNPAALAGFGSRGLSRNCFARVIMGKYLPVINLYKIVIKLSITTLLQTL